MTTPGTPTPIDSHSLTPGTILRNRNGGMVVLDRRKNDGTGWWNTDSSGLVDRAIERGDNWTVVGDARPEFPPRLISKWMRGRMVSKDRLVAELRRWADWLEATDD